MTTETIKLAQNPNTLPKQLSEIFQKAQPLYCINKDKEAKQIMRSLASNPNTPWNILVWLCKDFPEEFLSNPVFNLKLLQFPDLLWNLYEQNYEGLISLAKSSEFSKEFVSFFVNRAKIGENEQQLGDLLLNLSEDHTPEFHASLEPDQKLVLKDMYVANRNVDHRSSKFFVFVNCRFFQVDFYNFYHFRLKNSFKECRFMSCQLNNKFIQFSNFEHCIFDNTRIDN